MDTEAGRRPPFRQRTTWTRCWKAYVKAARRLEECPGSPWQTASWSDPKEAVNLGARSWCCRASGTYWEPPSFMSWPGCRSRRCSSLDALLISPKCKSGDRAMGVFQECVTPCDTNSDCTGGKVCVVDTCCGSLCAEVLPDAECTSPQQGARMMFRVGSMAGLAVNHR